MFLRWAFHTIDRQPKPIHRHPLRQESPPNSYRIETRRPPLGEGPTTVADTLSALERWWYTGSPATSQRSSDSGIVDLVDTEYAKRRTVRARCAHGSGNTPVVWDLSSRGLRPWAARQSHCSVAVVLKKDFTGGNIFFVDCPVPSMTVPDCSGGSDPKSETRRRGPYHPPAILTQRGHQVTGFINNVYEAPSLGPLLPAVFLFCDQTRCSQVHQETIHMADRRQGRAP